MVLPKSRRPALLQLLGLLCTCLALSAQAAPETFRVLAWPGYVSPEAIQSFEARQGVSVELTVVTSDDELWERARLEQGGSFDVMAVNTAELQRYIDTDLVTPVRLKNVPNSRNQLPRFTRFSAIPGILRNGEVYAIPYTYSAMGLIYNKRLLTQAPTSIKALWEPRFKDKVLAYNGSAHNFSIAAMSLGFSDPFRLNKEQFRLAAESLRRLRDNTLKFYSTPDDVVQLFRDHDVALVFANYGDQQVRELERAGLDVGYVIPEEGALAWLDCWAIARRARDRNLAEAWINHMLTPGIARQLTEDQGLANTLRDVPNKSIRPSDKLIWLEPVENALKRAAYWERILTGTARPHRN